jgi:hypothetical protein
MALQESLEHSRDRAHQIGLAGLEHLIPDETVNRAIAIAQAMTDPCQRSHALATLVLCTSGAAQASLLADALHAGCASHRHLDRTFCFIEQRLAEVAEHVPPSGRVPLDDEFVAEIRATEHEPNDPADDDPDHRARQLACLRAYLSDGAESRRPEPTRVPDPPSPSDWTHWRRALDAAVTDRTTVRNVAVEACLAVAEAPDSVDPTATQLARHLMAVDRWWPGARRTRPTGGLEDFVAGMFSDPSSERERWMSEDN